VEIHDGPYNVIKNWDYCGAVRAWHNGEVGAWGPRGRAGRAAPRPAGLAWPRRAAPSWLRRRGAGAARVAACGASSRRLGRRPPPLRRPSAPRAPAHGGAATARLQGKLWTARAGTEGEFERALDEALSRSGELCFIEVCVRRGVKA
jgi:hypothetical protein